MRRSTTPATSETSPPTPVAWPTWTRPCTASASAACSRVIGHAVIVHGKADDLKTQPSGNAGPRVACGVVGGSASTGGDAGMASPGTRPRDPAREAPGWAAEHAGPGSLPRNCLRPRPPISWRCRRRGAWGGGPSPASPACCCAGSASPPGTSAVPCACGRRTRPLAAPVVGHRLRGRGSGGRRLHRAAGGASVQGSSVRLQLLDHEVWASARLVPRRRPRRSYTAWTRPGTSVRLSALWSPPRWR